MEKSMTEIFQTILTNFGTTLYTGESVDVAQVNAETSGFECTVLRDGSLIFSYSPISGWKAY
jgi:hypothetical protein